MSLLSWRGIWRDKELFDDSPDEVQMEISNHTTIDGTKPLLKTWLSNTLIFHDVEKSKKIID